MSRHISTLNLHLEPADNQRLASLCGPFDDNIKQLERRLGVEISYRDSHFQLVGKPAQLDAAAVILKHLYVETQPLKGGKVTDITPDMVHLAIQESRVLEQDDEPAPSIPYGKEVTVKTKRGLIKPRSPNQAQYIANIVRHDICFGIGPAGTGKTYLAVAAAVDALERQEIRRILLTRPAVEAGEKLGFLPGDLSQKVDPYLRPLYDALFEMLGFERVEKLMERNIIEVAPLAYMRGRTLNDAFIILDEAQNTTTGWDVSAGTLDIGRWEYKLRFAGRYDVETLGDKVVDWRNGLPIYLRDVAEVRVAREENPVLRIQNGNTAIAAQIFKESGANALASLEAIKARVNELNREVLEPVGLHMEQSFDASLYINRAVSMVTANLGLGVLLSCAILWLFLRQLKATLMIALAIPITLSKKKKSMKKYPQ